MDPLTQFDVLVPIFQKISANTPVDQLDQQTPCEKWKVRDLYGHLLGGATTFAAVVRGSAPPEGEITAGDADLGSAVRAAVGDLDAAFRAPGALEQTIPTPFGDMPGEAFARLLAFDLLMHTWDLATATGQDLTVPDDVVAAVDAFARQAIGPELRGPDTFGPEVSAPAEAAALDRLVGFSGRRP